MNGYKNIGDLMGYFGVASSPAFSALYHTAYEQLENTNLDMRGAKWGRLQDVFTYEMWERYNNVEVMATFTDLYSDPRAIGGSVKYNKLTGSIPRHKAIVTLDEVDVTEKKHQLYGIRSALAGQPNVEKAVEEDMEEFLYEKLSAIPTAHKNTVNFMLGQLKSKLDFTLDDRTSAAGVKGLVFPSHVPEENRKTVKLWTEDANGKVTYNESVNAVEYFQNLVSEIKEHPYFGYNRVGIEMNAKSFKKLLKHPSWAKAIAQHENGAFYLVADNDKNAVAFGTQWLLSNNLERKIEVFKQICEVDEVRLNTAVSGYEVAVKQTGVAPSLKRNKMDCFEEGRAMFYPVGDIITIIPVAPNRADSSSVISTDIFGGRGLIEYWYEPREKVATWRSELTCLPVFTTPSQIYNVNFVEKTEAKYAKVGSPASNPKTAGYYEKVSLSYVLTADTSVTPGKTYYTKS